METVLHDLRYAVRMLLANPGFSVVCIITLALGIGANTAIFSCINGILWRPLPYSEPDRLVRLFEKYERNSLPSEKGEVAPANFADWRHQSRTLTDFVAFASEKLPLAAGEETEQVVCGEVSANLFSVLGVKPIVGREFISEEDQPGHDSVVVLSSGLWQRRFGSDQNLIGKTVRLDGQNYTVVGIMPAWFQFPQDAVIWVPLALNNNQKVMRDAHFLQALARIKSGVTLTQARAEMNAISKSLEQQYPATNSGVSATIFPLLDHEVGKIRPSLLVLWGAVGLVLLIACVNVASLMLARASARELEISVRLALGASRFRIVRQFLIESLVLFVLGGGLGVLLAFWGIESLRSIGATEIPRMHEIHLNVQVLGFTLALSCFTGIIFGLIPAFQILKTNLNGTLKEGSRRVSSGGGTNRFRSALVVSEIALAVVLLVGAGLVSKSFVRLTQVDSGIKPANLLTMEINLPSSTYNNADSRKIRSNFYHHLVERVEGLPGVISAGAVDSLPLGGRGRVRALSKEENLAESLTAGFQMVTPHYFQTVGINLLRGRLFNLQDGDGKPLVMVVNENLANRFWPGENPLGKRVFLRNDSVAREIVGVINNVKHFGLEKDAEPEMYVPYDQLAVGGIPLVVRTENDPQTMAPAVKSQVHAIDPDVAVARVRTMQQVLSTSLASRQFILFLLELFAALGLVLAAVGIYGLLLFLVSQRKHEIGIRVALGAQNQDVLKLVLGQGIRLTLAGIAIGLTVACGVTRLLSNLLFGVSATDPGIFVGIALLLIVVAMMASYLPARRALQMDPSECLRYE